MARDDSSIPTLMPSSMGPSNLVGPFRPDQAFTLMSVHHLLQKLRWDMDQLKEMQWDAELGSNWRQTVCYKAIDCATTVWHLGEWFTRELRATEPRGRACAFLGIEGHDVHRPIELTDLRKKTLEQCPGLEICRIVAIASKHYNVERGPRPDVRTTALQGLAHRGDESIMRQLMMLTVFEGDERRNMIEVLETCQAYWERLWEAGRPDSSWQPGNS